MQVICGVFQTGLEANGGVESFTQMLEQRGGSDTLVVTQIDTPLIPRWRATGAEVEVWPIPYVMGTSLHRGGAVGAGRRLLSMGQTNRRLAGAARIRRGAVVHCNDISALWHLGLGGRLAGAGVLHHVRDIKPPGEEYTRRWQAAIRLADQTLVLSEEMRSQLIDRLGLKARFAEKVHVVPSIVDVGRMRPPGSEERAAARRMLGIPDSMVAVGYVAAFNAKKNQLDFIRRAGPLLVPHAEEIGVWLLGDYAPAVDPYARACGEAAAPLGPLLRFAGFQRDMVPWYRALDVVVVPTRYEGLARCMIEALACGTPVVSFDVCSARECLELEGAGIVVPQGDYASLTAAMLSLAGDPRLRAEMGRRGVELARRRFSPEVVLPRIEEVYREATSKRGRVEDG